MKQLCTLALTCGLAALSLRSGLCQSPHFTPCAQVNSPTSGQQFNGASFSYVTVGVSTEHWVEIGGATANTNYTCTADVGYGVNSSTPYGSVTNNSISITTDALGAGASTPHLTESINASVLCGPGINSHSAEASTKVYNVPMGFSITSPNPFTARVSFNTNGT